MVNVADPTDGSMEDLLKHLVEGRQEFLASLSDVHELRISMYEHEIKRIKETSGTDEPLVQTLTENIKSTKDAIIAIKVQLEIGSIIVPEISEKETIIHGRITHDNLLGIKDLEVSLISQGTALDVKALTDASGYYSIVIPSEVVKNIKEHDTFINVNYGGGLIRKEPEAIKLAGRNNRFEVMLNKDEVKMKEMQDRSKNTSRKK